MIKQNKLSKGILAFALILLSCLQGWAQAERTASVSTDSKTQAKESYPAVELKNFEYDASNPELSDLRMSLLKTKVDLEYRQSQNQFSEQEIADRKETILAMENKVIVMEQSINNMKAGKYLNERKFTRSQFAAMTEADQKEIVSNLNRYEITDLANKTQGTQPEESVFYIPVADFKSFDVAKQIHIIKNPAVYVVVIDASAVPGNTVATEIPVITKYRISKAELNTFPPDKKQAIENSKDFTITE